MENEKKKCSCPPIQLETVEECQPCPPGIRSGFMVRFCGRRKNLRGVKRRVGDVWQLPRGYVCYTPTGWAQMEVPTWIDTDKAADLMARMAEDLKDRSLTVESIVDKYFKCATPELRQQLIDKLTAMRQSGQVPGKGVTDY